MCDFKDGIISGLGDSPETLVAQKTIPLIALAKSNLVLSELKIVDLYLARIDSSDPNMRTVVFEKGELERVMGVSRIRQDNLSKWLLHLGEPIKVANEEDKIETISLFSHSKAERSKDRKWTVRLTCSDEAKKHIFNNDNIGYLQYTVRSLVNLSSRYSYIMFSYIEMNRHRGEWEEDLESLKKIFNCHNEVTYQEYKDFNKKILALVYKELLEKTLCHFSYSPIKDGKTVVAIRFKTDPSANPDAKFYPPAQSLSLPPSVPPVKTDPLGLTLDDYFNMFPPNLFTEDQQYELATFAMENPYWETVVASGSVEQRIMQRKKDLAEFYLQTCKEADDEELFGEHRYLFIRKKFRGNMKVFEDLLDSPASRTVLIGYCWKALNEELGKIYSKNQIATFVDACLKGDMWRSASSSMPLEEQMAGYLIKCHEKMYDAEIKHGAKIKNQAAYMTKIILNDIPPQDDAIVVN